MPILIPPNPGYLEKNEETVWKKLKATLPDNAYLFSNLYLTDNSGNYEVDFVILWPDVGVLMIEVKGGKISVAPNGTWTQKSGRESKIINLLEDTRRTYYALRRFVAFSSGVVKDEDRLGLPVITGLDLEIMYAFPRSRFSEEFEHPGIMRDAIVDEHDLDWIDERIQYFLQRKNQRHKSSSYCKLIAQLLTTVSNPSNQWMRDRALREQDIAKWTEEQFDFLTSIEANFSYKVVGGPGSGKTYLALEQARRLTREGKRVGLIVYSVGLSVFLKEVTAQWEATQRPAFVGTFHSLARKFGVIKPDGVNDYWWDHGCAMEFLDVASSVDNSEKFDAFVVDEAQDFFKDWWQALRAYGRDQKLPQIFAFGDPDQDVFSSNGMNSLDFPVFKLTKNLRNSEQIAALADTLSGHSTQHLGIQGPMIQFINCSTDDAIHAADDAIAPLLARGWNSADIALITTGSRHPVQHELMQEGRTNYWELYNSDDDIFYAHTSGIKGLEKPVIVVAVNGFKDPERAKESLYVAVTRAREELVITGDLHLLREIGGERFSHILSENSFDYPQQSE